MTSIGELFPKCNKLAYDARQQLLQIQQQQQQQPLQQQQQQEHQQQQQQQHETVNRGSSNSTTADLFMVLEDLDRQLNIMEEELVLRESPGQREKWKRKIGDLKQVSAHLREQGQAAERHYQQQQQQQKSSSSSSTYQSERQELLLRRRKGNTNDSSSTPSTESDLHWLASEGESLESSHRLVNSLIDQGSANLSNLVRQRQQLRSVRGMLHNMGNRLGLTQSTMRIVERRDITDAYLVAACMAVTCLVFYLVWF
ncbi:hypothetical protein ACA910_015000 [Epithemia clementina (nom. ined.)]